MDGSKPAFHGKFADIGVMHKAYSALPNGAISEGFYDIENMGDILHIYPPASMPKIGVPSGSSNIEIVNKEFVAFDSNKTRYVIHFEPKKTQ